MTPKRAALRAAENRYYQGLRRDALANYSKGKPHCACCGESHIQFLAIDHINGGGNAHRKAIGCMSGSSFYRWLRRNDYPDGFRVLCHNCNFARVTGPCPHENEVGA